MRLAQIFFAPPDSWIILRNSRARACLLGVFLAFAGTFCISADRPDLQPAPTDAEIRAMSKDYIFEIEKCLSLFTEPYRAPGMKIAFVNAQPLSGTQEISVIKSGRETKIRLSQAIGRQRPTPIDSFKLFSAIFADEKGDCVFADWLICGLTYKVHSKILSRRMLNRVAHPAAYALASNGKIPDLRKIIEMPLLPEDGFAWTLSGELSDILIEALMSFTVEKDLIPSSAERAKGTIDPYSAFSMRMLPLVESRIDSFLLSDAEIGDDPSSEEILQIWFKHIFLRKNLNAFMPASAKFSKGLVSSIMKVTCEIEAGADNPPERRKCALDDLPPLEKIINLQFICARQEKYISEIMCISNGELCADLRKISMSFSQLRLLKPERFKKDLESALSSFNAKADSLEKIEKYLLASEFAEGSAPELNSEIYGAIKEDSDLFAPWPALENLLKEEDN